MPTFYKALTAIGVVLGIHGVVYFSGGYDIHKWIDIPMHFGGGLAIGTLALAAWEAIIKQVEFNKSVGPKIKMLTYALGILGLVALVGIAWEWYEFIYDSYASQVSLVYRPAQMGLGDTMADLGFDLLGGLLAFVLFRSRR